MSMKSVHSNYPFFNVLNEKEEWDEHTREVVLQRVDPFASPMPALDTYQTQLLKQIASHLLYDDREEILQFVVLHMNEMMQSNKGENQRNTGIFPQKQLVQKGLHYIDEISQKQFHLRFLELEEQQQLAVLEQLNKGEAQGISSWDKQLQQAFFKKILSTVVSAYYSHPTVWSEIGYAGPAYPRGYVRSELGLTDPWEARND
jgi:hypothetical protein